MSAPSTETVAQFPLLAPDRPADELEQELLARWRDESLFARTLAEREGAPAFVFFEGPPTANGRPGIHHVFARTIKDLFNRYRSMKGYYVARKAGWDTHGLPVEIEVEKQLGISGKQDIERIGVAEFNRLCRESVFRYREEWERLSERMAYWLDYEHPYVTYSNDYVESVWWALRTLYDRDRLYRGHKILPYCPRCGTALSSHEVAQGYKDVEDPSVFVALDLVGNADAAGSPDAPLRRRILVWTTTPWTLVSNVALAVNPELEYVELRKKSGSSYTILLAAARAGAVLGADFESRWDVVARMRGSELAGQRYRRPLDWLEYGEGQHEVIVAENFVSAEDGTGVVHMAPAFGADDYAAGQRHGLSFLQPVNARGEFEPTVPVVGGMFFKSADPTIIEELERRDVLWKAEAFVHPYPHCWRCGTPLLYYARGSWFVRTTAFRDEMIARNNGVDWHPPSVGEGRFGQWLENNIDWALSRDRFWGTPLPVWINDADPSEIEVIGSYAQLAERVGRPLPENFDPHKPFIDDYTWPAASGTGTMRRVPEVIDTWFDSGSMSFAQWHYPFENADELAKSYPADFIAEGVDQTRGWFYTLLAIATGLGDALPNNSVERGAGSVERDESASTLVAPYRSVVVNDMVLDAQGQKMSKSKGNAVDPWAIFATHGADAARLFLVSSSQVWLPRRFDEQVIRQTSGSFLLTLKHVYNGMFATLANFGWSPSELDPPPAARPVLDRWILSRLATVERDVDALLDQYDATVAANRLMEFFDRDVSKWWVRLSRDRLYEVSGDENRSAFATLHEVLVVTSRLLAPFAPFVSDWLHRALTGTSVHLAPFTRGGVLASSVGGESSAPEPAVEEAMERIRLLAQLGHAARDEAQIKVRQPLGRMVCVVPKGSEYDELMQALVPLLAAELNVKQIEFAGSADAIVTLEAKPNFRALGKKFGKATPRAAEAVAALPGDVLRSFEHGEPVSVTVDGETRLLEPDDLTIIRRAAGDAVVAESGGAFVALDPTITPALRREGLARELVNRIQRMRKDAGLELSDRLVLRVYGDDEVEAAAGEHHAYIAGEVLARSFEIGSTGTSANTDSSRNLANPTSGQFTATGEAKAVGDGSASPTHAMQSVDLDGLAANIAFHKDES